MTRAELKVLRGIHALSYRHTKIIHRRLREIDRHLAKLEKLRGYLWEVVKREPRPVDAHKDNVP